MAEFVKTIPLYADTENHVHRPIPEGSVIDPKLIPVSSDAGNALVSGTDGGLFVSPAEVPTGTGLVSKDEDNLLGLDNTGLLKVTGNDLLSNGDINLITIDPTDKRLIVMPDKVRDLLQTISDDEGNLIHPGTDGGAYVGMDDIVNVEGSNILYVDEEGKLDAGLGLGYDDATGGLDLVGHDGKTIIAHVDIPTSASVLLGAEFVSGKPDASGEAVAGDYHISLAATYANEPDGGLGITFADATKGQAKQQAITYTLLDAAHADVWPTGFKAYFNDSIKEVGATGSDAPTAITFDDGSTLNIVWTGQTGTALAGTATFTPAIGIIAGYYLHLTFRLSTGLISDVYIDLTELVDIYTGGCGIKVANNVISVVTLNTGGVQCTGGAVSLKVSPTGGLQTDDTGVSIKVDADGGLQTTADGAGIKVSPDGGLETNDAGAGIKVDPTGGLETSDVGAAIKVDPDGGLETTGSGTGVKVDPDGGLETTGEGTGIKIDPNGGLETGTDGAGVKTDPDGGLVTGSEGTGIDPEWLNQKVTGYETKYDGGNGISISGSYGATRTITAVADPDGGLQVVADGIALKLNGSTSGLQTTADGTQVVAGDGISVTDAGVNVDMTVVRTSGTQTINGTKTFSQVLNAATPAASAAGTELINAQWIRANIASLIGDIISTEAGNAITVTEDGKLKVITVSADNGNLLTRGSDGGAYTPYDYGTL